MNIGDWLRLIIVIAVVVTLFYFTGSAAENARMMAESVADNRQANAAYESALTGRCRISEDRLRGVYRALLLINVMCVIGCVAWGLTYGKAWFEEIQKRDEPKAAPGAQTKTEQVQQAPAPAPEPVKSRQLPPTPPKKAPVPPKTLTVRENVASIMDKAVRGEPLNADQSNLFRTAFTNPKVQDQLSIIEKNALREYIDTHITNQPSPVPIKKFYALPKMFLLHQQSQLKKDKALLPEESVIGQDAILVALASADRGADDEFFEAIQEKINPMYEKEAFEATKDLLLRKFDPEAIKSFALTGVVPPDLSTPTTPRGGYSSPQPSIMGNIGAKAPSVNLDMVSDFFRNRRGA